jgi:transcriptional regulator with XRE-family HTH domain
MRARKYNSKTLADILADIPKSLEKQVSSTMAIAALIDDEMKKNNLSIDDVAKIFKVKPETIGHWLSGSFDFKISTLCKIEEKINIELFKITKYQKNIISKNNEVISINFTTKIIKNYIEMGYVPRMDGSLMVSDDLTCDCCGKNTTSLSGFENNNPKYPDIGLCIKCFEEYAKLIHSHEQSTNETNDICRI